MGKGQRSRRAHVRSIAFVSVVVAIVGIAAVLDLSEKTRLGSVTMPVPMADEAAPSVSDRVPRSSYIEGALVSDASARVVAPAAQTTESADVLRVVRAADTGERIVPGQLLVSYDPTALADAGLTLDDATVALASQGFEVLDIIGSADVADGGIAMNPLVVYSLPDDMLVDHAASFAGRQAGVSYAEPNYVYSVDDSEELDTPGADVMGSLFDSLAIVSEPGTVGTPTTVVNDTAARSSSGVGGAIYGRANQWWLFDSSYETSSAYRATLTANGWSTSYRGSKVLAAWDYARTNGDVTIAIIDTGARLGHEDLAANVIDDLAYDAYRSSNRSTVMLSDEKSSIQDECGHGTHVAGIAAGVANNGVGLAGSSYNANIIPIRAGDANGNLSMSAIARAFTWVVNSCIGNDQAGNLRVINCSFGTYSSEASCRTMLDMVSSLRRAGVLTVAAGGNGKNGVALTSMSYPSDSVDALAVTSLEFDGTNSVWSDYNRWKDVSAPGEYIYSTLASGGYGVMSGTSMSAPLVSGLAALCWSYDPALTVDEVVDAIKSSANPIVDRTYNRSASSGSAGAIDALATIKSLAAFTISAESDVVAAGGTLQLVSDLKTEVAVDWNWETSDPSVATVDEDGVLHALSAGTVNAHATGVVGGELVTLEGVDIQVTPASGGDETPGEQVAAPEGVAATSNQLGRVIVSWEGSDSADVTGYRVWRSAHEADDFTPLAEVSADATSYVDTDVEAATSYDYAVSVLEDGKESSRSEQATGYPLTSISSASIEAVQSVSYTGQAHEPRPAVTLGGKQLVADTDFTYSWLNNVNAARSSDYASPTVRITGIGYYTGIASRYFTIDKVPQRLSFDMTSVSKTYGDPVFRQSVVHGSGDGAITYASTDTSVAAVDTSTGRVTIKGAGAAYIVVSAAATTNFQSARATYQLTVGKATLTATYAGGTATVGSTLPTAVTVSGFVNGEAEATAKDFVKPTVNTSTAVSAGSYELTPYGGSARDYTFVYRAGTLVLTAASQPNTPGGEKPQDPKPPVVEKKVLAYRLYNAWSRESVYVATVAERNALKQKGWNYSGIYLVLSSQVQTATSIIQSMSASALSQVDQPQLELVDWLL